jgi:ABC-2 type transport system permease protein
VKRIAAILGKEFIDLRLNPSVFLPAAIAGIGSLFLPFLIAVVIPYVSGEQLSDSSDFDIAIEMYREQPGTRTLDPEGAIQAWLFQQFLLFLLVVPVVGATSIAGHSVVGEKRARTLEPLLATPITTFELLAAKTLAALVPAIALSMICFAVYLAGIAVFGRPGVAWALLTMRSLSIMFLLGPLAVLAALQVAVCVSSRVDDERSAQQWGSLIVLPIVAMFVAPLLGSRAITLPIILSIAVVLVGVNAVLMRIGIRVFDRESILTRWK